VSLLILLLVPTVLSVSVWASLLFDLKFIITIVISLAVYGLIYLAIWK
jgi:hypothetical protein